MTLALLCSGQGRQDRHIFAHFIGQDSPVLDAASAVLGTDVRSFAKNASDTDLHANRFGQVLCVARALAMAEALFPTGAPPGTLVGGYSVGEIAAWGVAGIWSVADTLALVDTRARAMDAASGPDDGLGYVRGLSRSQVEPLATQFDCAIAIVNPDRLLIVGGTRAKVAGLCETALTQGAAHAALMPVYVASHTPKLEQAVAPFAQALAATPMARPALRLMTATDQTLVTTPARHIDGLARQISTTIDWAATLEALAERGVDKILELGPGSALADMAGAALPGVAARSVDAFKTLDGAREWLAH